MSDHKPVSAEFLVNVSDLALCIAEGVKNNVLDSLCGLDGARLGRK